ncbi:5447_t:CDS:2 [Entrophospora sp. SA101]|nr:5447_t:CDS:2 [Entrophospora sp. SA101]
MDDYNINGGGLKTNIKTLWTFVYDCVSSIIRLKKMPRRDIDINEYFVNNLENAFEINFDIEDLEPLSLESGI